MSGSSVALPSGFTESPILASLWLSRWQNSKFGFGLQPEFHVFAVGTAVHFPDSVSAFLCRFLWTFGAGRGDSWAGLCQKSLLLFFHQRCPERFILDDLS